MKGHLKMLILISIFFNYFFLLFLGIFKNKMSVVTISEEYIQQTESPALVPFYQTVKVSPINNITQIPFNDITSIQVITFKKHGEKVINLSKCYLDYTLSELKFSNKYIYNDN